MNRTRLHVREAQMLIEQARRRTELSVQSLLESANRILTWQLHRPDVVLDTWILYQRMVTPATCRSFPRDAGEL